MKALKYLFNEWWEDYSGRNPSVLKIEKFLESEGEAFENDHIALRTLSYPGIDCNALWDYFSRFGYRKCGEYEFPEKKLFAIHLEREGFPKIFISELVYYDKSFSKFLHDSMHMLSRKLAEWTPGDLIEQKHFWQMSHKAYEVLYSESEYAAWFYAQGFRPNHFTINVNSLVKLNSITKINTFIKEKGLQLNQVGGEVKGSALEGLVQSSTIADSIELDFLEGKFLVPSCYFEFAQRFDVDGKLFQGFISDSADKLFESTNRL